MNIQTFSFQNFPVSFNQAGYLHATAIAEYFGKRINNYLRNERTQEYMLALCDARKSVSLPELVIVQKGNSKKFKQGTWLHPKLAIHFARWLDPKFAVWCDEQIEQILSGSLKLESQQPALSEPSPLALSEREIGSLAALTYYAKWMGVELNQISRGLREMGARDKASSLWTIAHESRLQIRQCHEIALRMLPHMNNRHFAESVQHSLHNMQRFS